MSPTVLRILTPLALLCGLALHCLAAPNSIRQDMQEAYAAFKELQLLLAREEAFSSPANRPAIAKDLRILRDSFHTLDSMQGGYKDQPGFAKSLDLMGDLLVDSSNRFREGKVEYARSQLRSMSKHCFSCHSAHNVRLRFFDDGSEIAGLSFREKGELLLASRQFEKARQAFLAAAWAERSPGQRLDALRRWLFVTIRVDSSSGEAASGIERALAELDLADSEQAELRAWRAALKDLDAGAIAGDPLTSAARLLKPGGEGSSAAGGYSVRAMRAVSLLHGALDAGSLRGEDRAEALYLLGVAYSRLHPLFIEEQPEIFLEQCIDEFRGSEQARRAYSLYETLATGRAGAARSSDVNVKLKELHDRAYGIVPAPGSI